MRPMKDSGVEWIGEIPEGWAVFPVRYAFTEVKEKNHDGSILNALQFKFGDIIPKKNFEADNDNYVADTILNYTIVEPRVIMINGLNLNYDFKTIRVGIVKEKGVITSAYLAIKADENKINAEFAMYLFRGYEVKMAFHNMGVGIRLTLGFREFRDQPLLLPPITEQKRIVTYLNAKCAKIDALIAKQQEIIEKLKAYKLSVITEAVTKGLNPNVPMKDSGYSFVGDIPKAWLPTKLKYITLAIGDGIHATPDYDEDGEYFFLNGNSIGQEWLVFKENTDKLNEVEFRKYKSPLLTDDTILITLNGATYGKTSFYHGEKVLLGKSAGYITLRSGVDRQYVRYYLQSRVAKIIMELSLCGSTIANLSLGTLNDFFIPLPSIEEQKEIADYLNQECDCLDSIIGNREQMICKLTEYKKSLIYEVVTGKREVNK